MTTPIGLAGVQGDILVTSPPSVTLADISYTDSGDHQHYTISDAAKRYLDPLTAVSVQISTNGGSSWSAAPSYTIVSVGGAITFASANASGTLVRLHSGKYFPYASIGNTTDWQFTGTNTFAESTSHQGPGGSTWSTFLPLLTTGKITCKKWWVDWTLATNLFNRDILVVSCVTPASNRYEAFCYVADSNLTLPVNALVGQDLTFQITNQLYPVV